jgi:predicted cation transporter
MSKSLLASFYGGLVAGTIDIFSPALIYWVSPVRILQSIARGVLGKQSFEMGLSSAVLGLLLQWAMSILIAFIFVYAAARMRVLTRNWIAAGVAYGIVVFFVMNYIVVPLSMVAAVPHFTLYTFAANMAAMWLFGLIIAWFAQAGLPKRV